MPREATLPPRVVNVPGDYFSMAGFEVTLYGRFWVTPEEKKTRIDAKRVAEIIGCSHETVLKGGAGTGQLTGIRNGTRQVPFILEEVLDLAQRQEEEASSQIKGSVKK